MKKRHTSRDESHEKAWLDWIRDDTPPRSASTQSSSQAKSSRSAQQTSSYRRDTISERYRGANPGRASGHSARSPRPTPAPGEPARSSDNISINIHLPQLRMPSIPYRVIWQRLRWGLLALTVLLVAVFAGKFYLDHRQSKQEAVSTTQGSSSEPSFEPVTPKTTKSDKTTVDSTVAYDPQRQLYKFNDVYEGANIVVSQQILPEKLRTNPDTLKKAAASIGASDSFQTSFGTVYVATAPKGGAQRLVFTYQKLLVFISSDTTLENLTWSQYILSLKP